MMKKFFVPTLHGKFVDYIMKVDELVYKFYGRLNGYWNRNPDPFSLGLDNCGQRQYFHSRIFSRLCDEKSCNSALNSSECHHSLLLNKSKWQLDRNKWDGSFNQLDCVNNMLTTIKIITAWQAQSTSQPGLKKSFSKGKPHQNKGVLKMVSSLAIMGSPSKKVQILMLHLDAQTVTSRVTSQVTFTHRLVCRDK